MARKKVVLTRSYEEWEYEDVDGRWIPEDDEGSASWKALGEGRSGRVRSRAVVMQKTAWAVKQQDAVRRVVLNAGR